MPNIPKLERNGKVAKKDFSLYQKKAEKLARQAGEILQEYREEAVIRKQKGDALDITTDADLASERFLTKEFHKLFPDHNIFAEEHGDELRRSDFTWIIDPLDGTKEYTRGLPLYSVLIALEYKREVVVGVVFRPSTDELFSASKGRGALLNGKKIFVSKESELKNSFIWTHLPTYKTSKKDSIFIWDVMGKLRTEVYRIRANWEDATTLCWLAQGGLEGFVLTLPQVNEWWDVAPGLLMIEEAGGKVTDMYGEKIKNRDLSKGIIASNGKIHQELLKYFKQ